MTDAEKRVVTILRYKRNGERLELPLWTALYEKWLPTKQLGTAGSVKAKDSQKARNRRKREVSESDDDDDEGALGASFPKVLIDDANLHSIIVDKRHVVFSNCSKRDPAPKRLLRKMFSTEDTVEIAKIILAVGEPLENDASRAQRHREERRTWATVSKHVELMFLNRFSGVSPEDFDVRSALSGGSSGEVSRSVAEDVFDDPFIEITEESRALTTTALVIKTVRGIIGKGCHPWIAAGLLAREMVTSEHGVPMLPDCVRRGSRATLVVQATGPIDNEKETARAIIATVLMELEALVMLDSSNPRTGHEESSASEPVLVDSAFVEAAESQEILNEIVSRNGPRAAPLTCRFVDVHALTIDSHLNLLVAFSERSLEIVVPETKPVVVPTAPQQPKGGGGSTHRGEESLENLTHAQLQAMCKQRGLGTGGKKKDLLLRLGASD